MTMSLTIIASITATFCTLFVSATVAVGAFLKVIDTFFLMLSGHPGLRMLMAAVAGV